MKSENAKANWAIVFVVCFLGLADALDNHKSSDLFFSNLFKPILSNLSNLFTSPKQTKTVVIPTPRGEYGVMNVRYSPVDILKTSTGYVKFRMANGTVIEHSGSYQIYTSSP